MTKHFDFMKHLNEIRQKEDFEPSNKHKPDIMKSLVHAADIGNPSRTFEISKIWTMKILSEFFA